MWPGSSQSSSSSSLSSNETRGPDFTDSSLSSYSSTMSCEESAAQPCARCATPTADQLPQTQPSGEHATGFGQHGHAHGQRRMLRKEDTLMSIDCESPRTSSTPPAPSTFNVQTVSPPLGTTAPTLANSIAEEVQSQLEPRLVGMLTEWQNKQNLRSSSRSSLRSVPSLSYIQTTTSRLRRTSLGRSPCCLYVSTCLCRHT